MNDWAGLLWLFVLLAANAFFVAAEFAVISARRSQIEPRAERGSRAAKTALFAMEHATLMLATSQLGITVCSLLILNVSEPAIHHLLAVPLYATGLPSGAVDVIAFAIALIIVSFLHVVFGEMVPKNLAFSLPDRAVLLLAPPLVWVSRVFHPIIWALNSIANGVLRLFRVEPKNEVASAFTLGEVATIVTQSQREGVLDDSAGTVSAVVEFTVKKARDIAVPLADLVTLPEGATPGDIERAVAKHGFSRYVLVEDGEPTGYVHLKDVLRAMDPSNDATTSTQPIPAKRIHHMVPVQEDTDLEDALALMRRKGRHLARVRNSEGRTTAVLFLEDIIEELVGEVQDATRRGHGR
ncbi:CBS domain containing-hemolysin-like protein [Microbacterium keratanolyticum]|uniref:Membrane protein n=1 Tax=Microbacterium keratanolyticum TaxID=67574 RepID=A0A9W6HVC6_9MICO|nr:hemolysin family protein [Microbacterium keratanolyticum]MBM7467878.1 CBS domain containing-hemolysin-like protein [Microbacterium keratanolyticum]GLK02869.1 membrane protein [Microbacterium keratanolyticum]